MCKLALETIMQREMSLLPSVKENILSKGNNQNMKKRVLIIVVIAVIVVTTGIGIAACTPQDKSLRTLSATELHDLGDKYLLEMNYEQALLQFVQAIEIEPKNASLYIKAAEAYIGLGDKNGAIDILEKGLEQLSGYEEIKALLDSLVISDNSISYSERRKQDREIYTQYLTNGGYDELLEYGNDKNYIEISTCLVDLNADGTYELLISLMETEFSGPRGYPTTTALLSIQEDTVKIIARGYSGGGSIGGDFLELKYDTQEKCHVLVLEGLFRVGSDANFGYSHIYSSDGNSFDVSTKIERNYYSYSNDVTWYEDDINKIKTETTLYYEEDDIFTYYQIDGEYVSKDEYEAINGRFIDPIQDIYKWHSGTYENPI